MSIQRGLLTLILAGLLAVCALWWWAARPLALPEGAHSVQLQVPAGSSARSLAHAVVKAGVAAPPWALWAYFRVSGKAAAFKAGSYEIEEGDSLQSLVTKLAEGRQALVSFTIVEGWNIRQVRLALARLETVRPDSALLSDQALMQRISKEALHPEGRFFPDTYRFAKGSSDIAVLQMAARAMDRQLAAAWDMRNADSPLQNPEQALILASIIEKETGKPSDRAEIGGVFANRLRIGMLLQTDPTVIYGMGEAYRGNIRKRDLQTDTPYNTYTRAGLPPTPIAMPGKAALLAAVQPAATKALYFVARGDGSSQFSATLQAHNRAVNQYIRGQ